jgi:hypothetical protein
MISLARLEGGPQAAASGHALDSVHMLLSVLFNRALYLLTVTISFLSNTALLEHCTVLVA